MTDRTPLFPQVDQARYRVHVCLGVHCTRRGSPDVLEALRNAIRDAGLGPADVELIPTSCRDRCDWGPSVNVYPGPVRYASVDPAGAVHIVQSHLRDGVPVEDLRFRD